MPASRPASVGGHRVEEDGEREDGADAMHSSGPRGDERPVAIGRKKW